MNSQLLARIDEMQAEWLEEQKAKDGWTPEMAVAEIEKRAVDVLLSNE